MVIGGWPGGIGKQGDDRYGGALEGDPPILADDFKPVTSTLTRLIGAAFKNPANAVFKPENGTCGVTGNQPDGFRCLSPVSRRHRLPIFSDVCPNTLGLASEISHKIQHVRTENGEVVSTAAAVLFAASE